MCYYLKSLMLLAALPLCLAAMSQEAAAKDRFTVKLEVVKFRSLVNTDPGGNVVTHKARFLVDIEGMGKRTLHIPRIIANPLRMTQIGAKFQFTNVEKPERKQRQVKLSSYLTGFYWVEGKTVPQHLGLANGATSIDLFKEADHSNSDTAAQTIMIRSQNYMMIVRVT